MLSLEEATGVLQAAARELESMSYEELGRLADAQRRDATVLSWRQRHKGTEVNIEASLARAGRLRHRVCVELILTGGGNADWGRVTPCVYFERYASGRLYRPRDRGILSSILYVLATVFLYVMLFVGVVSAIGAGVWYVMHLWMG